MGNWLLIDTSSEFIVTFCKECKILVFIMPWFVPTVHDKVSWVILGFF
uniref:Uncharacterized protein n=1 Tax=Rhizophora mucronata TaxID=61149 RepID=A0A2P2N7K6_RHIMU